VSYSIKGIIEEELHNPRTRDDILLNISEYRNSVSETDKYFLLKFQQELQEYGRDPIKYFTEQLEAGNKFRDNEENWAVIQFDIIGYKNLLEIFKEFKDECAINKCREKIRELSGEQSGTVN